MNGIKLQKLGFSRGRPIFQQLDFTFAAGKFTLLMGDSGSGKSTLLRLMAGFAGLSYSGQVLVDGVELKNLSMSGKARKIGLIFQNPNQQFTMKTLYREAVFALENLQTPAAEIDAKITDAANLVGTNQLLFRSLATLSGGEKQKAALTVLLAMDPPTLLLDEPFASVDAIARKQLILILCKLRDQGKTIILCDHDSTDYADVIDHFVELKDGQLEESSKKKLKQKRKTFCFAPKATAQEMLRLEEFGLMQGEKQLIKTKHFQFNKGITVMTGENGTGKSTLLKAIVQRKRYTGRMYWQHSRLRKTKKLYNTLTLGVQQARQQFVTLTPKDEILYGQSYEPKILMKQHEAVSFLGLQEKLDCSIFQLSEGQMKMIQLISMLSLQVDLLLLDEPFAGLDERACNYFAEWIKEKSRKQDFLIVTHRLAPLLQIAHQRVDLQDQQLKDGRRIHG